MDSDPASAPASTPHKAGSAAGAVQPGRLSFPVVGLGASAGGLAALMAISNNLIRNPFSQPLIKYEIFAVKFILQSFFFYLVSVVDNATFQVKNIFKSFV